MEIKTSENDLIIYLKCKKYASWIFCICRIHVKAYFVAKLTFFINEVIRVNKMIYDSVRLLQITYIQIALLVTFCYKTDYYSEALQVNMSCTLIL